MPVPRRAGWRTLWFGSESPTGGKVALTVGLLGFLALGIVGMTVEFIPADGLHGAPAMWVFGCVGLMLTVAAMLQGIASGRLHLPGGLAGMKAVLGILLMPALVGVMLWLVCIKALPWAYARVLGEPVDIIATMQLTTAVAAGPATPSSGAARWPRRCPATCASASATTTRIPTGTYACAWRGGKP